MDTESGKRIARSRETTVHSAAAPQRYPIAVNHTTHNFRSADGAESINHWCSSGRQIYVIR